VDDKTPAYQRRFGMTFSGSGVTAEKREGGPAVAPPSYHFGFEGVSKWFDARRRGGDDEELAAVEGVSFGVRRGEVVSLVGPSGCGKSTLLSIGAGLSPPTRGRAYLGGTDITKPRREIALMLQKDLLLPWRTVLRNAELGIEVQGYAAAERRERALTLLAQCKLDKFTGFYPHELSGGMRQRAALARTLALDPEVLLLDEPFSALDAQTRVLLRGDLARMLQIYERTTLLVTHDIVEALALSDRVIVMSHRPGTILREIVVELPYRDDPFKRSLDARVNDYVAEIWEMLKLAE
jgi:NitT/TauT family transport system ATP-binding protein